MNETRGAYGATERAELRTLAEFLQATATPVNDMLTETVTRKLRLVLPDLDDVTIGRVLVALIKDIPSLFSPETSSLEFITAGLTGAGLELTESAWRE